MTIFFTSLSGMNVRIADAGRGFDDEGTPLSTTGSAVCCCDSATTNKCKLIQVKLRIHKLPSNEFTREGKYQRMY